MCNTEHEWYLNDMPSENNTNAFYLQQGKVVHLYTKVIIHLGKGLGGQNIQRKKCRLNNY